MKIISARVARNLNLVCDCFVGDSSKCIVFFTNIKTNKSQRIFETESAFEAEEYYQKVKDVMRWR
ncbi:hypothetical protein [Actinobacillus equuli]|uniref:Uncharacterized protein n=1 Tax=Actinobacillus equuli TaxID=718 RepID=A0AAX3FQ01_ACTEU|nr:hypothetical protein [Actinobacillus equuli]AIZ78732.1 hypothetical protein ACEE_02845 [Actinobacillus equuli subsp. equuli]WGE44989.1 hypothetical protein NYR65_02820 [Actinobacillus equuli subsp. equuli]VEE92944.1 Uncharacterised protein [Actinobacillus equuli]